MATENVKIQAKANLEQLKPYLCPTYVGFPNTVPDVYRAAEFIKEFKQFEKNDNLPNFIIMLLPNDHTSGHDPAVPHRGQRWPIMTWLWGKLLKPFQQ